MINCDQMRISLISLILRISRVASDRRASKRKHPREKPRGIPGGIVGRRPIPQMRQTRRGRFIVMERVRAKPEPVFAKTHGSDARCGRPSYVRTVNSQCQCEEHKNPGSNSRDHDPKAKTLRASRVSRLLYRIYNLLIAQ